MMNRLTMRMKIAAIAVGLIAVTSAPAGAQPCNANMAECSPVMKQMAAELGQAATSYWTPKLNEYKVRIDAMLSSTDLETLNRLRVRWAVLVDEHMRAWSAKANVVSATTRERNGARVEMRVEGKPRMADAMDIFAAAKEIAGRYRSGLDRMNHNVLDDVAAFVGTVSERADQFAQANKDAIAADKEAHDVLEGRKSWSEIAAYLRSEKGRNDISMVYAFAVEPIVLLYNGADLVTLFNQASPFPKPIVGLELPDAGMLKQNFPNPASSTTRIVYTTTEPATDIVFRVFNSRGDQITLVDQGAMAAGEHAVDLDVSRMPSGSYLYHLTVLTAKGPRVYSKTMQVVH